MFFYSNIGEYSFFAFAFKNHFCFFSAQGLDEAMLRVVGTSDVSVNITFATNNDLVDRIYGVSILLPMFSSLFSCTIILFFLLVSFQVTEIRTQIIIAVHRREFLSYFMSSKTISLIYSMISVLTLIDVWQHELVVSFFLLLHTI